MSNFLWKMISFDCSADINYFTVTWPEWAFQFPLFDQSQKYVCLQSFYIHVHDCATVHIRYIKMHANTFHHREISGHYVGAARRACCDLANKDMRKNFVIGPAKPHWPTRNDGGLSLREEVKETRCLQHGQRTVAGFYSIATSFTIDATLFLLLLSEAAPTLRQRRLLSQEFREQ